jgi:hypothetical protein
MTTSHIPHVAIDAGLSARYRYWTGASGARYLFTRIDADALSLFERAVVLAARSGRIVWAGEAADLDAAGAALKRERGTAFYVHLLAGLPECRRAIVADLRPVPSAPALAA